MVRQVLMKKYFALLPIIILLTMAFFYPKNKLLYKDLVRVSGFSEPSYRVFWHEPRFRLYQKASYLPYPEMPSCDRLRFVYKLTPKEIK